MSDPQPESRQYPQPFEGITGTLRDDFLLSLDVRAVAHRDALIAMAHHLRTAIYVGHPAPVVQEVQQRVRNPRVGDLVVECTKAIRSPDRNVRLQGLGILLAHRMEWYESDEEWEKYKADETQYGGEVDENERTTDEAWYLQWGNNPGHVFRWHNAEFMALPLDPREFDFPLGSVATRDNLVGALAHSGFELRSPDAA